MKSIHPLSAVIIFTSLIIVGFILSNIPLSLIILAIGILVAILITAYTIPRLPKNEPETYRIEDEETTGTAITRLETLLTGKIIDLTTWDGHHYNNVKLDPSVSPQISMERQGKSLTISLTVLTITTTDLITIDGKAVSIYNFQISPKKPSFQLFIRETK